MNAQAKPSEPSMEEILASIRRIIADDEVKPAEEPAAEAAPAAEASTPPDIDDDVLDLGAEAALIVAPAAEAPVEPPAAPEPAAVEPVVAEEPAHLPTAGDTGDIDFVDPVELSPEPQPAAGASPAFVPPAFAPPPMPAFVASEAHASPAAFDMAQLLSDQASSSVNNAFGQLAHTVLSNNARTLEDLVKDMLKPMLKTWLDDNLPTMVERLVRAEIERVARGGRH
jgi:cell pole-organizing protein PopZ